MGRRKLLAVAGALSATAFATTVGVGANLGLFDMTQPDSGPGRLEGTHIAVKSADQAAPTTIAPQPSTTANQDGRGDDD